MTWQWLEPQIRDRILDGLSLCITDAQGVDGRGGYFFHMAQRGGEFVFSDFESREALVLPDGQSCVRFMNHVSGRQYDEDMWELGQELNLKSDDDVP